MYSSPFYSPSFTKNHMLYSHSNAHNYGYYTAPNQSKYPNQKYSNQNFENKSKHNSINITDNNNTRKKNRSQNMSQNKSQNLLNMSEAYRDLDNKLFNENSEDTEDTNDKSIFEIFGIKLYSDDILLICLIFFLFKEGVQDEYLFISLILLLLS